VKDKGRVFGYGKAISAIKGINSDIVKAEDVDKVYGIGEKIKKKIKDFLE
jgi:DNA uptake protein ComE-like DNA-binding protein